MDAPKCPTCGERHWARVCPSTKSSDGGVESRHATLGVGLANVAANRRLAPAGGIVSLAKKGQGNKRRPAMDDGRTVSRADATDKLRAQPNCQAGVAPGPSEAKPKRAPRGSFDRAAYQREFMRRKRARLKESRLRECK